MRAQKWPNGMVRCIILGNARLAPEYVNLSAGSLGFVGQFVLSTGTPRFCHRTDLGKTVEVALPGGRTAHRSLVPSWPLKGVSHCRRPAKVADATTAAPLAAAPGKTVREKSSATRSTADPGETVRKKPSASTTAMLRAHAGQGSWADACHLSTAAYEACMRNSARAAAAPVGDSMQLAAAAEAGAGLSCAPAERISPRCSSQGDSVCDGASTECIGQWTPDHLIVDSRVQALFSDGVWYSGKIVDIQHRKTGPGSARAGRITKSLQKGSTGAGKSFDVLFDDGDRFKYSSWVGKDMAE